MVTLDGFEFFTLVTGPIQTFNLLRLVPTNLEYGLNYLKASGIPNMPNEL